MNMKILKQLTLILAICLSAEALVAFLPFAFPSSVAAILILAILLGVKLLKEQQIQETADFMLKNMALVFVPLAVGMVEDLELLKGQTAGFLLVVGISLILTFLGTYGTVRLVQKCMSRFAKKGGKKHE